MTKYKAQYHELVNYKKKFYGPDIEKNKHNKIKTVSKTH